MIDHIGIRTHDLAAASAFYAAALAPLGYSLQFEYPGGTGFGSPEKVAFWIAQTDQATSSLHIAFAAPSRAAVTAFYEAAIKAGAKDNGAPGVRELYHPDYFGAFVIDADGNNVEAVCHHGA